MKSNSQHRSFLAPEQISKSLRKPTPYLEIAGGDTNACHLIVKMGSMDTSKDE